MSTQESNFIKWFAGIAAALLVSTTIGAFSILNSIDVMAERINHNTSKIVETRNLHNSDLDLIREDIKEIKTDMKDIKKLLMK